MYSIVKNSRYTGKHSVFSPAIIFMASTMIVNGGNYLYNLILGRTLVPTEFSHAGFLVTLLLIFSFLAMTFQIVSAKFSIELNGQDRTYFHHWISRIGRDVGLLLGIIFFALGGKVASFFQLPSAYPMHMIAVALPFFFVMSVRRGFLQGQEDFVRLSASYQTEMWVKLLGTFSLIFIYHLPADLSISVAITASILCCYWLTPTTKKSTSTAKNFDVSKTIIHFLILTAIYEGTQIVINYSDILIVKHYFDHESAGLYTSMALIGRIIYFATWMIVMLLIPKILTRRKQGLPHKEILIKYLSLITVFSTFLTVVCYFFDEKIVTLLFGEAYVSASSLLWKYALATTLFALANLLIYYFLCLDQKAPVYLACLFGILQVFLLNTFHYSLNEIIWVQVINMGSLFLFMIVFLVYNEKRRTF